MADPPYGTTACKWDSIIPLDPMWDHLKRVIKPNGAIVMTSAQPFTTALISSNIDMFKYCWYWKKSPTGFLNAKKMPMKNIEDVCVFYSRLPTYNPQGLICIDKQKTNHRSKQIRTNTGIATHNGGRLQTTYFQEFSNYPGQELIFSNDKGFHPTQKPAPLMEYLIKTYTHEGETVLDFTMGSGTTGVACANTNRNFIGIELDDKYFEIAKERIQKAKNDLSLFNVK